MSPAFRLWSGKIGSKRKRRFLRIATRGSRRGPGLLRNLLVFLPSERQRVFALTLVAGVASGLVAVAFHASIRAIERLFVDRAIATPGAWGLAAIVAVPTIGGLVCGLLLDRFSPEARGSGIPQVKIAFAFKDGRIPLRVAAGKFLIGALQLGTGASLGREGPTVQICAGVSSALGRAAALSRKNMRGLIPVGAAAGIAAAFNAPIAAVTFAIEEVLGDLDHTLLSGVVIAAAIAAVVERSILGEHPVFTTPSGFGLHHASSLLLYALLGVAAAAVSIVFTDSLLGLRAWFSRLGVVPSWARPGIGGLVTGALAAVALGYFGTGGITGGGYETIGKALEGGIGVRVLLALCALKLVATVFSYSSGGAGGIFAPSLFLGVMLGGAVGWLDVGLFGHGEIEIGAFALVGMGAVFAGIVRAPITSVLIIFEMTDGYELVLPLMIANMIAYAVARHFRPSPIYEALLEQDGVLLPHRTGPVSHALEIFRIDEVMTRRPVTVPAGSAVGAALDRVADAKHPTYPVVDGEGRCIGIVGKAHLRRLVAEGDGDLLVDSIARDDAYAHPDYTLGRAVLRMERYGIHQLAVVERETQRLVGIITMDDVMRAQAAALTRAGAADETQQPGLHPLSRR